MKFRLLSGYLHPDRQNDCEMYGPTKHKISGALAILFINFLKKNNFNKVKTID